MDFVAVTIRINFLELFQSAKFVRKYIADRKQSFANQLILYKFKFHRHAKKNVNSSNLWFTKPDLNPN